MSASRATLAALATLAATYSDGLFDDAAIRAAGSTSRTLRRYGLIHRVYLPEVFAVYSYDDPELEYLDGQAVAYGWDIECHDDWRVAVCVVYHPRYRVV
jgi:hypothetical protein